MIYVPLSVLCFNLVQFLIITEERCGHVPLQFNTRLATHPHAFIERYGFNVPRYLFVHLIIKTRYNINEQLLQCYSLHLKTHKLSASHFLDL